MENSKIYHILSAFSEIQRLEFIRYCQYSYGTNELKDIPNILRHLVSCINENNKPIIKKDFFKKALNKVPDNNKMNLLLSEAVKVAEQFIVMNAVQNDNDIKSFYLSKFYYNHQLNIYFEQIKRRYDLLKQENLNLLSLAYQVEMSFIHNRYLALKNNRDLDLFDNRQILEEFYITWKLKLDNIKSISWINEEVTITPQNPLFLIYSKIKDLFENKNESLFKEITEIISNYENLIDSSELRIIMMLLDNFCINQLNEGKIQFVEIIYDLYKKMIQYDVLLDEDNSLLAGQYKNIITIALRTKSFEWAKWFLECYKNNIRDDNAEAAYIFNKANISFEMQEFDYCLQVLNQTTFKDFFYKLTTKRIMIKSLYILYRKDRTYLEPLLGHLNAFKKYIYTKKNIPKLYQETNKNFYKFINQFVFSNTKSKKELELLKIKIQDCLAVADKNWLLSML